VPQLQLALVVVAIAERAMIKNACDRRRSAPRIKRIAAVLAFGTTACGCMKNTGFFGELM
jgi:hypothetical protein